MDRVELLDTTLREGEQTPGVHFPLDAKIAIARQLDEFGVDFIEAGHPVVSDEIRDQENRRDPDGHAVVASPPEIEGPRAGRTGTPNPDGMQPARELEPDLAA